jgi:3-hydroxybutyryl-CoA dehydrogenase
LSAALEVSRLGVVGAGTMGSGIAQLAALGGYQTRLHDPFPEALESGIERIRAGLAKGVEKGRWSAEDATGAGERLEAAGDLEQLGDCQLVIEAVPERLDLKHELFARLSEICSPSAVLATNTSSLPVTAIAAAATNPERVVGMHFFNPPVLMELLEVVAGMASDERSLATARDVGERIGRRVIVAADGPGFLANRCGRPFGLEALKLLQEGVADHATIDRIVRIGGGFRMGPFELMDLVGLDVGLEVTKSFWEQSFHEPRWRPSMIAERNVQAGRHGRKSGRGYYEYPDGGSHRAEDPPPPAAGAAGAPLTVTIVGHGSVAAELRELTGACGHELVDLDQLGEDEPLSLIVDATAGRAPSDTVLASNDPQTAICILCVDGSLSDLDAQGNAIGFHVLPPLGRSSLVELTRSAHAGDRAATTVEGFFNSLGKQVEWVGDAPGLVLGRIFCQLVNEAAFAVTEGVGSAADIDVAMRYGYNYPQGPLEWADIVELDQVLATLDALRSELGEERYRAAPLLRRMVAEGKLGRSTGAGFFTY